MSPVGAVPPGPANGFTSPPGGPGRAGPATEAPAAGSAGRARPVWRSAPALVGVTVLVIIGLVVGGIFWKNGRPENKPPVVTAPKATPTPTVVKFSVSSYTTNGTGFRDKGSTWETQTYTSRTFGNLKKGVGLVLDLGSAKELTSISFNAESGPLTVELHSADEMPAGQSGGELVGKAISATGETALDASKGGKHRYWMIWVTRLAPSNQAVISDISVSAVASGS
jgi:hypothetical protein